MQWRKPRVKDLENFETSVEQTQTPPESLLGNYDYFLLVLTYGEMTARSYWLRGFSSL
jgi:hypothetical protein